MPAIDVRFGLRIQTDIYGPPPELYCESPLPSPGEVARKPSQSHHDGQRIVIRPTDFAVRL